MDFSVTIKNHVLEYYDEPHLYLCDGVMIPSITTVLKHRFGNKYDGIPTQTLKRASDAGTEVHRAIQDYCETGKASDLPEVRNFKFLQKHHCFMVEKCEVPVILFMNDLPVCAGRLDMVISIDDHVGGADIKRTSVLDKEYLAYQLNLYRIAYRQCYGVEWEFLRGIHLRDQVRKFVDIPINEKMAMDLMIDYVRCAK
ncbi:MAG: hypothetical protein IJI45_18430 [Anaerolineaceae bacterium]|nr:hypothetical protein [Anaerolineaceae bacterium]